MFTHIRDWVKGVVVNVPETILQKKHKFEVMSKMKHFMVV